MNPCDNCNRNICHGCPHQEPDKTLAQTFTDNLEVGWDYAIEKLDRATFDCVILELIGIYWRAYRYMEDNDVDGGRCFEVRQYAINEILKRLEAQNEH